MPLAKTKRNETKPVGFSDVETDKLEQIVRVKVIETKRINEFSVLCERVIQSSLVLVSGQSPLINENGVDI